MLPDVISYQTVCREFSQTLSKTCQGKIFTAEASCPIRAKVAQFQSLLLVDLPGREEWECSAICLLHSLVDQCCCLLKRWGSLKARWRKRTSHSSWNIAHWGQGRSKYEILLIFHKHTKFCQNYSTGASFNNFSGLVWWVHLRVPRRKDEQRKVHRDVLNSCSCQVRKGIGECV